jgi:hypothetical protein
MMPQTGQGATGAHDGPRALGTGEWEQLNYVVSTVFRPSMFANYPQLFNERNRENLRVVGEGGRLVCHVGYIKRPASLAGCKIDVCCIGAVATLDEARGKGYASLAFQDACDKAAADGVDVMLISGGRGLYTRVGCRQVGNDLDFSLDETALARLASVRPPGGGAFAVEKLDSRSIPQLSALYAAEPVRFIRHGEDWEMAFECGVVMNTPSEFWGVTAANTLVAYLIVHRPDQARRREGEAPAVRVVEFAGQRAAVMSALSELRRHYGTERVTLHVQGTDPVLGSVLRTASGVNGTPNGSSGTIRILNFEQLMERCRPLLVERAGIEAVAAMTFHADSRPGSGEGSFSIRRGGDEVRIPDLASLGLFVFGSHRPLAAPDSEPVGSAPLLEDLRRALPLPSLWYGMSYV